MCYGDIHHGTDGYYEQWAREQIERLEREQWSVITDPSRSLPMPTPRERLERMAKEAFGENPSQLELEYVQAALRELVEMHREDRTVPMLFKVLSIAELDL
jgi:hypothetical protein